MRKKPVVVRLQVFCYLETQPTPQDEFSKKIKKIVTITGNFRLYCETTKKE